MDKTKEINLSQTNEKLNFNFYLSVLFSIPDRLSNNSTSLFIPYNKCLFSIKKKEQKSLTAICFYLLRHIHDIEKYTQRPQKLNSLHTI